MFDRDKAGQLARDIIVKYIESGYYHPTMYTDGAKRCGGGRVSASSFQPKYRTSGETMFGQDRTAGHDLFYSEPLHPSVMYDRRRGDPLKDWKYIAQHGYRYKNAMAKEFWQTIDARNAKDNWCWGYMGGADQNRLMFLAGQIMYDEFMSDYLPKMPIEIQKGINEDDALAANVFYTTWNGTGWRDRYISTYKKLKATNPPRTTADINRLYYKARVIRDGVADAKKVYNAIKYGLGVDTNTYNQGRSGGGSSDNIALKKKLELLPQLVLSLPRRILSALTKRKRYTKN